MKLIIACLGFLLAQTAHAEVIECSVSYRGPKGFTHSKVKSEDLANTNVWYSWTYGNEGSLKNEEFGSDASIGAQRVAGSWRMSYLDFSMGDACVTRFREKNFVIPFKAEKTYANSISMECGKSELLLNCVVQ